MTWGTSPDQVVRVTGHVPDPASCPPDDGATPNGRSNIWRLSPACRSSESHRPGLHRLLHQWADRGSSRRRARRRGTPGRGRRSRRHRAGLAGGQARRRTRRARRIFGAAGFEWHNSGCSMCLAMNGDILPSGMRCASSTNRNFEGRQGTGGRTHLMSPAMVAAAAISGALTDIRTFETACRDADPWILFASRGASPPRCPPRTSIPTSSCRSSS